MFLFYGKIRLQLQKTISGYSRDKNSLVILHNGKKLQMVFKVMNLPLFQVHHMINNLHWREVLSVVNSPPPAKQVEYPLKKQIYSETISRKRNFCLLQLKFFEENDPGNKRNIFYARFATFLRDIFNTLRTLSTRIGTGRTVIS